MPPSEESVFRHRNRAYSFVCICAVSILWVLSLVSVVGFGPGCAAAYYTTVKVIRRGRGKVLTEFCRSFRENWKNGAGLGLLSLLSAALLVFLTRFSSSLAVQGWGWVVLSYIYFFMLWLLGCWCMFLFPAFSRFHMKLWHGVKFAAVITIKHLFTAVTCLLVWYLAYWIVRYLPAMLLVLPGVCMLICSHLIEPILRPFTEGTQESDLWYLE